MLEMMRSNQTTLKLVAVLLILTLVITFSLQQIAEAGVVSDFLGLKGTEAFVVDSAFSVVLSGAGFGGAVFELGNTFYDVGTGLVKAFSGGATTMDYIDLGINAAAAGGIIAGIILGGASVPIAVAVIVGVKICVEVAKKIVSAVKIAKGIEKIGSWLKKHIGNPLLNFLDVYKPNIYIYCSKDVTVNVKVGPSGYITASIPEYNEEEGWNASVERGSINGVNDYLFYEARIPDQGLQREEGFLIHGRSLRQDMERMLDLYLFNTKEKDDFLAYWGDKLTGEKDYVFYPQGSDRLDQIMPLTIVPRPDSVFRLWFLIEEVNAQKDFKVIDKVEKIERYNYIVVEWGGVCANLSEQRYSITHR